MISNSSPLIFLAKIDQLSLLKRLFGIVSVPSVVKEEVLNEEKPGFVAVNDAIEKGWIKVVNPNKIINVKLGKGESAAISLAKELNDDLIIDDALGVRVARSLGIEAIRTTSVILTAVKKKIIGKKDAIKLINRLLEEGYYIAPRFYAILLERLNS
jgi:predicted nucleic acid-binding protein